MESSEKQQCILGKFIVLKKIGHGSWGHVVSVRSVKDGKEYAVKILNKAFLKKNDGEHLLKSEIKLAKELHHPNVLKIYGCLADNTNYYLIMELCKGITLTSFLIWKKKIEQTSIGKIIPQIISGICFLHERSIIHGDIKMDNIIVDPETLAVKLIDLGYARKINLDEKLSAQYCSIEYAAPEILCGLDYNPFAADVWAVGIVIYTTIVGRHPFGKDKQRIISGTYDFPNFVCEKYQKIISHILVTDPESRPAITEVNHMVQEKYTLSSLPPLYNRSPARSDTSRSAFEFLSQLGNKTHTPQKKSFGSISSFIPSPSIKLRVRCD